MNSVGDLYMLSVIVEDVDELGVFVVQFQELDNDNELNDQLDLQDQYRELQCALKTLKKVLCDVIVGCTYCQ